MKNFMKYLVKDDEEQAPVVKKSDTPQNITKKPGSLEQDTFTSTTDTKYTPTSGDSKKDDYVKLLSKAIQEAHDGHPSAPDYIEFVKALNKMEGKPMDEETKFTSIFAGFDVQGVTVEKLISAAEHYKQVVSGEKTQFDSSMVDESNNTIGKSKASVNDLTGKNVDIDKQMKNLSDQKQANLAQINKLNNSIQTDSNKLECRKNDFNSAFNEVTTEIDNNIGLIKKHLQPTTTTN